MLSLTSNPAGLIWGSGRAKREQELVDLMSGISQHYGDDWWFNADYAMALSDNGQQEMARPRIEQSMAKNPRNAWGAHALGHLYYECNEHDAAINFMRGYLHEYPRQGLFYGHLHWHLALSELHAGNYEEGLRLYNAAFGADSYFGVPRQKLADASSFLWRAELAGHPRDAERWRSLHDFGLKMFPKPSTHMADWHFALTNAAVGDGAALEARIKDISDLARAGRYPSGQMVPVISRAFAAFQKQDYCAVIEMLEPKIAELARIGGSRAQTDLIELTLMRAYIQADRLEDLRRLLARRRVGPSVGPVTGIERIH